MTDAVAVKVAHDLEPAAVAVFLALFLLVTVLGFVAATWRPGDLARLDEWGLAGRRFGPVVTWFLLGGSIFTAYTYIAVPEVTFSAGGAGFFALAYTVVVFPLILVVLPRLWAVYHRHGYITAGDFVRGRYGSGALALAIAVTGVLATMPYIALQLVGIQVVVDALGVPGDDVPLVIAFVVVAAYTYHSGLRAPALIAIVKDVLIFVAFLTVVVYVAREVGGLGAIFDHAERVLPRKETDGEPGALLPRSGADQLQYASLALGSALALILYPHVLTVALSARSPDVIRRNAIALPIYTLLLGIIALLGFVALKARIEPADTRSVVPDLILHFFGPWFSGFALAAIAIGALVPSAIMSIGVANLFTRNIYKEYLRPHASDAQEAQMARLVSLVVKAGALVFVLAVPATYTIDLQLLGGVWIIQTLPAVIIGLYTRWLHRTGLLAGWAAGMLAGTAMAAHGSFATPTYELHVLGAALPAYEALYALALNLAVAVGATVAINSARRRCRAGARSSSAGSR